jgi:hypothetical protein
MGVYYRLVNLATKERIEPSGIGDGGVKRDSLILGKTANLFMFLVMTQEAGTLWLVVGDNDEDSDLYYDCKIRSTPDYCEDATEKYRLLFNESMGFGPLAEAEAAELGRKSPLTRIVTDMILKPRE